MKIKFTLFCLACMLAFTSKSQVVYTHGNITATIQGTAVHDSTMCQSTTQLSFAITIQNSFVGDSVKIVWTYANTGTLFFAAGNTTGQTTWNLSTPGPVIIPLWDNLVINGIAHLDGDNGGTFKIISGLDTIYNVADTIDVAVPNPCLYSTVSGRVYADYNGNCIFDGTDVPISYIYVSSDQYYTYLANITRNNVTDGNGLYQSTEQISYAPSYDLFIPPVYQFAFGPVACSPVRYDSLSTLLLPNHIDFALQCTNSDDVLCFAFSSPLVRPLVPFDLFPTVLNTGCPAESGTLTLILDSRVTYNPGLSANLPIVNGDTLTWQYINLSSLSTNGYWNDFLSAVSLTPNNQVHIGDSLCFSMFITISPNDVNPANNSYSFCIPVVNSYDPNAKEVSPAGTGVQGYIPASDTELTYTIHFQNTGNATALNISVVDTLDNNVIPESLQILGTSKNLSPLWNAPNIAQFNFYGINLPDSGSDQAGSNSAFRFKIKLKPSLASGTQIKNTAAIYFDSNPAVFTNTALNTIEAGAGVQELSETTQLKIFPNPASTNVTVTFGNPVNNYDLRIINISGQTVLTRKSLSNSTYTFDINELSSGLYFVEISSNGISQRTKLIKTF